jgi:Cu(I)/Ag(I) efflux system membrane fusion protein
MVINMETFIQKHGLMGSLLWILAIGVVLTGCSGGGDSQDGRADSQNGITQGEVVQDQAAKGKDHSGHDHSSFDTVGDIVYTCSMHPEVRSDEPGTCPICGMNLTPVDPLYTCSMHPEVRSNKPGTCPICNMNLVPMEVGADNARYEHDGTGLEHDGTGHEHDASQTLYTCSMHPEVRSDKPGTCPICNMNLVPIETDLDTGEGDGPASADGASGERIVPMDSNATNTTNMFGTLRMREDAVALAGIQTTRAVKRRASREVVVPGRLSINPNSQAMISSYVSGRLEEVFVREEGAEVREGERMFSIYSPDLISAQKELIEAAGSSVFASARTRLLRLGLTKEQVDWIASLEEPEEVVDVMAPVSGVVTAVHAVAGMYVKEGTPVAEVADFSVLWLEAELSQGDLAVAMQGDSLFARVLRPGVADVGWSGESEERVGSGFKGFDLVTSVDLVDPIVGPVTRTGWVRGTIFRGDGERAEDGDRGIDGDRTVPAWRPGQLLAVTWTYQPEEELLLIPESAVLWTGDESIVYTMEKRGTGVEFRGKRVKIGQKYGNFRHVVAGLEEGEEVVKNGAFRVDSEFQLSGRPGMIR